MVGNRKGLVTRQRQPKYAARVLRKRYLSITMGHEKDLCTGNELLDKLIKFEINKKLVLPTLIREERVKRSSIQH